MGNQPVEIDQLVNLTAILLEIKDRPTESLDDEARRYLEARITDTTLMSDPRLDSQNCCGVCGKR